MGAAPTSITGMPEEAEGNNSKARRLDGAEGGVEGGRPCAPSSSLARMRRRVPARRIAPTAGKARRALGPTNCMTPLSFPSVADVAATLWLTPSLWYYAAVIPERRSRRNGLLVGAVALGMTTLSFLGVAVVAAACWLTSSHLA